MISPSILVSPNAFKGTLRPSEAAALFQQTLRRHKLPCTVQPLADGGDGTLDVLLHHFKGRRRTTRVKGPLGRPVRAEWGLLSKRTAVIEMARASGLALIRENRILDATSEGTGQLILAALNAGCRTLYIGVGGTATGDGGAGALQALGLRYLDKKGRVLKPSPRGLKSLHQIDFSKLDPRLKETKIFILCDVRNPLLGPRGSARVFGPQKGATPQQVRTLERFLSAWARFAPYKTQSKPGAGAAGALAFGLSGFLGAYLVDGAAFIMKTIRWSPREKKARVILTGEGRLDKTSFSGKVIGAISARRGRASIWVICGENFLSPLYLRKKGITLVKTMGLEGRNHPRRALVRATEALLRDAGLSRK